MRIVVTLLFTRVRWRFVFWFHDFSKPFAWSADLGPMNRPL